MMKRFLTLLVCFVLLSSLFGCTPATGEMTYEGIYVKTANVQHILIHSTDDGEEFFLLQAAKNCKSLDSLDTGDKITITVASLAYETAELSERSVLDWSKSLSEHTDVPQTTLEHIHDLLSQSESK